MTVPVVLTGFWTLPGSYYPISAFAKLWHCTCISSQGNGEFGKMHMTYSDLEVLIERQRWIDRAPKLPLVGFLVGSGLSLLLWGAIAVGAYVILV